MCFNVHYAVRSATSIYIYVITINLSKNYENPIEHFETVPPQNSNFFTLWGYSIQESLETRLI
jgi:hypothetical protein